MARIRTIKPEFFTDSDLCELNALHRLLFVGLWCHADRDGRLEDKPRELRVRILPYDNCSDTDVDKMLENLSKPRLDKPGHVVRYQIGARRYIAITRFLEHQHPHIKEPPSVIPCPPDVLPVEPSSSPVLAPGSHESGREEGKGREGKDQEGKGTAFLPPQPSPVPVPLPAKPDDPFASGEAFFAYVQNERFASGFVTEKPPRNLSAWFSEAMMELNNDGERLAAALAEFARDPFWKPRGAPFAGFVAQWRSFVPQRRAS